MKKKSAFAMLLLAAMLLSVGLLFILSDETSLTGMVAFEGEIPSPQGALEVELVEEADEPPIEIDEPIASPPKQELELDEPPVAQLPTPPTQTEPTPRPALPRQCSISSVTWDQNTAMTGELASFTVRGLETCNGQTIKLRIIEEDFAQSTETSATATATFTGSEAKGTVFLEKEIFDEYTTDFWEFDQRAELRLQIINGKSFISTGTSGILSVGKGDRNAGPQNANPFIIYVTPGAHYNFKDQRVLIFGNNFDSGAKVLLDDGSGWKEYPSVREDHRHIRLTFPQGHPTGIYRLKVRNPDLSETTVNNYTNIGIHQRPTPNYVSLEEGCGNAFWKDYDCDGYGQGGMDVQDMMHPLHVPDVIPPMGKDANDFDPSINTPASAAAKYGGTDRTLNTRDEFVSWIQDLDCIDFDGSKYQCYQHQITDLYFIAEDGDDNTGTKNDPTKPFKTYNGVKWSLKPGSVLIYREGRHKGIDTGLQKDNPTIALSGTKDQPILIMAAPGERAILRDDTITISIKWHPQWLIFDGLELNGLDVNYGVRQSGVQFQGKGSNLIFRNMEITRFPWGVFSDVGRGVMENVVYSRIVIHNSIGGIKTPEHGFYFNNPDGNKFHTNWTIKDSTVYFQNRHGVQSRPPNNHVRIIRNVIHSNALKSVEFKGDIKNSEISNNLFFNNGVGGFMIVKEHNSKPGWTVENLKIMHNLFWNGPVRNNMGDTCWAQLFNGPSSSCHVKSTLGEIGLPFTRGFGWSINSPFTNIQIANNIIVTNQGQAVSFTDLEDAKRTLMQKNVLYSTGQIQNKNVRGMWGNCLTSSDGTHDVQTDGGAYCSRSWYFWDYASMEHSNRPNIKENTDAAGKLGDLFIDAKETYAQDPGKFNFMPTTKSLARGTFNPSYATLRDLKGNTFGQNPNAGPYQFETGNNVRPTLDSINPTTIENDVERTITLNGNNFLSGAITQFNGGFFPSTRNSNTQITLTVPKHYTPGTYKVRVLNTNSLSSVERTLQINPSKPFINHLNPKQFSNEQDQTVTITGANFVLGTQIYIDDTPYSTTRRGYDVLTFDISKGFKAGTYTVYVKNSFGESNRVQFTVTLGNREPRISSAILRGSKNADDLNVEYTITDPDNDTTFAVTDWRKNGKSFANVNIPLDVQGTAKDYSSTPQQVVVGNAVTWRDGVTASSISLALNGADKQGIVLPQFRLTQDKTISFWTRVRTHLAAFNTLFECGNDAPWMGIERGGDVTFWSGSTRMMRTAPITAGPWTHITYTSDAITGQGRIYINGKLAASGQAYEATTTGCGFGKYSGETMINADIDDILIFDHALSSDQITEIYNAGNEGKHLEKIKSSQTKNNEVWQVYVTAVETKTQGNTLASNSVTIGGSQQCRPNTDTRACPKQLGVCKGSQEVCDATGNWPGCTDATYTTHNSSYQAVEDACDGLDNDCDGEIDEGCNPAFNFDIAVNPSSGSAVQGGYNETTITITKTTTGSSGTVLLSMANRLSNITAAFFPSSCNFDNKRTSCTSRLRIDVGLQAKTGINTIAIEGTSEKTKKLTTYNLDVKKKTLPGAPVITSIQPNVVSNRIDTDISINGANFTELAGLLIGTILLPIDKTIPINETLIRYLTIKNTLPPGIYPITAINLDAKTSNTVNLTITNDAATQKVLDTDLDTVPNLRDKCPRTPSKLHQRTKQGKSGCPLPNYGKFNKTITTNFTNITNPHQIPNFKIGIINKGQITFKENISITKVNLNYLRFEQINLEENIDIKKTSVRLDEQNIPTLNVKSEIELYNTSITNPVPTRNKKVCNDCKITNYNTKTTNTKIEVQGWSEYEITQGRCGDKYCSITETKNNCPNDCGKTGGSGGGGGGGSGGGGGGGSPSNTIKINLDDNKTHTKTIKEGTKIDLTLNGKIHQLEITKTENNTATIHFKNISKILTTKTLELYSIDITLDNKKDIELYTTKTKNTHEITIKKIQQKNINEKDKKQNNTKNKKPTTKETPKTFKPTQTGLWILIIGILLLIVGIYWKYSQKQHK